MLFSAQSLAPVRLLAIPALLALAACNDQQAPQPRQAQVGVIAVQAQQLAMNQSLPGRTVPI